MTEKTPRKSMKDLRPATRLVHGGTMRSQFGEMSEALFLTQGFAYESMEQAEARFTGAVARLPVFALRQPDRRHVRAAHGAAGGRRGRARHRHAAWPPSPPRCWASSRPATTWSRPRRCSARAGSSWKTCCRVYGIASTLVDGSDLAQWQAAVRPNTKTFFLESPTNPQLEIIDIRAVADIAHGCGATLVVDNVFATPMLQSPLKLGADCVVYSATKHVDGQGRVLGGCILGSEEFIQKNIHNFLRQTGPAMSPFNAWVMLKSLETLPLRVAQQVRNAEAVADFLAEQGAVARVLYPWRKDHPQHELAKRQMSGGGTVVVLDVNGGKAGAFRFGNALEVIKISNNLGDAKSILTHPATTTHQRIPQAAREAMGIGEGMLRLSVGLEDIEDLIDDLKSACAAV